MPHLLQKISGLFRLKYFSEMLRYALVALVALGVDLGVFYILSTLVELSPIAAATIAYSMSLLVNLLLCVKYVFGNDPKFPFAVAVFLFVFVGLIGLLLTDVLLWFFISVFGLYFMFAKFLCLGIVFLWSFNARRLFMKSA
jgi:putative flippase GtrA